MSTRARLLRRALALPGPGPHPPVLTWERPEPGPRAVVCANLHGDECVGTGVVQRLHALLPDLLRRGAVRLYPSLNPAGLRAGTRALPGEDQDLNRCFPGTGGGPGASAADAVWRDLMAFRPDLVLDLHADSPACVPYAILDRTITPRARERTAAQRRLEELAAATGLTWVHDYPEPTYRRFQLDRSLAGALVNHGEVLALTIELGPRRMLPPRAVEDGCRAVLGVLTALGLLEAPATAHPSRAAGGPWRRDPGPRTTHTGLLCPLCGPGALLAPGEALAEVRELDGTVLERLTVAQPVLVLALFELGWCAAGSATATLAVRDA